VMAIFSVVITGLFEGYHHLRPNWNSIRSFGETRFLEMCSGISRTQNYLRQQGGRF